MLVLLLSVLLPACRGAPPVSPGAPTSVVEQGRVLREIAEYSLWIHQQPDGILRDELARLEGAADSPERSLRIAFITGQQQSGLYDPERTAQLLGQLAGGGPESPVHADLAKAMLGVVPSARRACAATECEFKLTTIVQLEEQRRRELSTRIDSLGRELETERNLREKLENQVEALKSLEAQIKNRDGPQTP